MNDLYYKKKSYSSISIDEVINSYGVDTFKSPYRSTIPLLAWIKHDFTSFQAIFKKLGLSQNSDLIFEYSVSPPDCKSTPSQTDLMIIDEFSALAIEAKWTESRYPTVEEWYDYSVNRRNVLNSWINLLDVYSENNLNISDLVDIPYQMIHRAASACAMNKSSILAYLLFDKSHCRVIEEDLRNFWDIMGMPANFKFYMIVIDLKITDNYNKILLLPKNNPNTEFFVKSSLLGPSELFQYDDIEIIEI